MALDERLPALTIGSLPAVQVALYDARRSVEDYLQRLNAASPLAERRILRWGERGREGAADGGWLRVAGIPMGALASEDDEMFLGEAQAGFCLDLRARSRPRAQAGYGICLPLSGQMSVTLEGGETTARAGEGVIVDLADVERTQIAAGTHFVEFMLPQGSMLRLGAELDPGALGGVPRFEPRLATPLAQKLLFMATQAASALQSDAALQARRLMFRRWTEMIALTLLAEQPMNATPGVHNKVAATVVAAPVSLRRALDFIDAHAASEILLADIAAAACVSASSLLRLFQAQLGQSPGAFLRQVRLDRARAELRRGDAGPVRDLALRFGFQSASKFSHAYLRRFGERPSDTRAGPA